MALQNEQIGSSPEVYIPSPEEIKRKNELKELQAMKDRERFRNPMKVYKTMDEVPLGTILPYLDVDAKSMALTALFTQFERDGHEPRFIVTQFSERINDESCYVTTKKSGFKYEIHMKHVEKFYEKDEPLWPPITDYIDAESIVFIMAINEKKNNPGSSRILGVKIIPKGLIDPNKNKRKNRKSAVSEPSETDEDEYETIESDDSDELREILIEKEVSQFIKFIDAENCVVKMKNKNKEIAVNKRLMSGPPRHILDLDIRDIIIEGTHIMVTYSENLEGEILDVKSVEVLRPHDNNDDASAEEEDESVGVTSSDDAGSCPPGLTSSSDGSHSSGEKRKKNKKKEIKELNQELAETDSDKRFFTNLLDSFNIKETTYPESLNDFIRKLRKAKNKRKIDSIISNFCKTGKFHDSVAVEMKDSYKKYIDTGAIPDVKTLKQKREIKTTTKVYSKNNQPQELQKWSSESSLEDNPGFWDVDPVENETQKDVITVQSEDEEVERVTTSNDETIKNRFIGYYSSLNPGENESDLKVQALRVVQVFGGSLSSLQTQWMSYGLAVKNRWKALIDNNWDHNILSTKENILEIVVDFFQNKYDSTKCRMELWKPVNKQATGPTTNNQVVFPPSPPKQWTEKIKNDWITDNHQPSHFSDLCSFDARKFSSPGIQDSHGVTKWLEVFLHGHSEQDVKKTAVVLLSILKKSPEIINSFYSSVYKPKVLFEEWAKQAEKADNVHVSHVVQCLLNFQFDKATSNKLEELDSVKKVYEEMSYSTENGLYNVRGIVTEYLNRTDGIIETPAGKVRFKTDVVWALCRNGRDSDRYVPGNHWLNCEIRKYFPTGSMVKLDGKILPNGYHVATKIWSVYESEPWTGVTLPYLVSDVIRSFASLPAEKQNIRYDLAFEHALDAKITQNTNKNNFGKSGDNFKTFDKNLILYIREKYMVERIHLEAGLEMLAHRGYTVFTLRKDFVSHKIFTNVESFREALEKTLLAYDGPAFPNKLSGPGVARIVKVIIEYFSANDPITEGQYRELQKLCASSSDVVTSFNFIKKHRNEVNGAIKFDQNYNYRENCETGFEEEKNKSNNLNNLSGSSTPMTESPHQLFAVQHPYEKQLNIPQPPPMDPKIINPLLQRIEMLENVARENQLLNVEVFNLKTKVKNLSDAFFQLHTELQEYKHKKSSPSPSPSTASTTSEVFRKCYVKIGTTEQDSVDIATNDEGKLSVDSVLTMYAGTMALKYTVDNRNRISSKVGSYFDTPDGGWNSERLYTPYPNPKTDNNKPIFPTSYPTTQQRYVGNNLMAPNPSAFVPPQPQTATLFNAFAAPNFGASNPSIWPNVHNYPNPI